MATIRPPSWYTFRISLGAFQAVFDLGPGICVFAGDPILFLVFLIVVFRCACSLRAAPVAKGSAAIPVRSSFFIDKRSSTLLPDCSYAIVVAGALDTQDHYIRRDATWHDTGISPNSIRTRIGWLQHCSRDSGQDPDFGHYHSDHPQALALPLNSQARA
jgi:hypothetical protein